MGSFATTFLGGLGFIAVGCFRAFRASIAPPSPSISEKKRPFYSLELTLIAVVSFLFLLNSFVMIFKALEISDHLGFALQLQNSAVSSLFLLYAVVGIADFFTDCLPLPSSMSNLVALFAFLEEFLLFYHQRKDPAGVENRYFSLLLVPIAICICCIVMEISHPRSRFPGLGIGIGLILQGTWLLQMSFSFFTSWITNGCFLHERSRGDYTIKCKGHAEYHRSRAIATLQFNLHLAAFVILTVGAYSILIRKMGTRDYESYKRISRNEELQDMGNVNYGQFTLDSDEEDAVGEIIVEKQQPTSASVSGSNGLSNH
ncbi:unnamed protein product [Victoria cruziana]